MKSPKSDNLTSEQFEAKQNLTGFFKLLLEADMRNNPQSYENNGNTNNPYQGE